MANSIPHFGHLPGLLKARGGHVEVWNNRVFKNNHRNFAPKGNIVGKVPPGTGVMILATNDVNIRHNRIEENCTASCTIASYFMTEIPIKDTTYNPYPSGIFVHENFFSPGKRMPTWRNKLGFLFWWKFGRSVPHVLYDGIQNPAFLAADGSVLPQHRICVRGNENGTFANLHADKNFKKISRDLGAFDCGF